MLDFVVQYWYVLVGAVGALVVIADAISDEKKRLKRTSQP